jgi:crotonobetainyl-CoA:carnitine CoA-transferase CaiB-like acyl-CoA transferase
VTPVQYDLAPPLLGENTDEVLASLLDIDSENIAGLRQSGVIG